MPPRPVVSRQTASKPRDAVRLYYLDWLRVLAILMVFVYHTTRLFNLEYFYVKNPSRAAVWRGGPGGGPV